MLNEYFPAVIEPVERYGGIVNQFQGDAMLITFNIPVADSAHADHAASAALEMQRAVDGKRFAGVQLKTRIGIATGPVIAPPMSCSTIGRGGCRSATVRRRGSRDGARPVSTPRRA